MLQLLLVEVVLIAVLVTLARNVVLAVVTVVAGAALLAGTLARRQGRWWLDRQVMAWQLRRRRYGRPDPRQGDPRLTALHWLAPDLSVRNVAAPDGAQVGVARDDAGWFAVAALSPGTAMRDDPSVALRLDALVRALNDTEQPAAVLQIVTHTVPSPNIGVNPDQPAGRSYRDLLKRNGSTPFPVDRVTWVAVRLDGQGLAEAGAGDADPDRAPAVTAALIRRVTKSLRRSGSTCQVLDADGLLAALLRSCDLTALVGAAGDPTRRPEAQPAQPREDWQFWHSGSLAHASFWIDHWPPVEHAAPLLDWLSTAPATMSSIAITLVPEDDTVDMRCLTRVAAPPNALAQVCDAITQGARLAHAHMMRLDGEHGPAVYASAPTGGGAL